MRKQILPALILLLSGITLPASAQKLEESTGAHRELVFVITGESNSGGTGKNSEASPKELEPRSCVQIMNLTSGDFEFEDLKIGVNNLRDHYRLEDHYTEYHGLELGLANAVEANVFPEHRKVYLIKTGHGGSRILQWTKPNPLQFWEKFLQRTDAAKRQLPDNPQWVVWFSLGINDGIDKVSIESWKVNVRSHLERIKNQLPGAVIVMTQFQSMGFPEINKAIAEIAEEDHQVVAVDSTGATLMNKYHWSYEGLKTMADRMIESTREQLAAPSVSSQNASQ